MSKPFVSVLTPTYNRSRFVEAMIGCYKAQIYPKDRMEWIVLDDGTEPIEPQFKALTADLPNIRYIRHTTKLNIGAKRNRLNDEAKGDILIAMDDDDFYPPERVDHVVKQFLANPMNDVAGSTIMYMFFSSTKEIIRLGPYGRNHATNGTMACRASYAKKHRYDEYVTHAEEVSFLDNYKHSMIQLDPMKTILVITHSENTFGKEIFLKEESPFVKKTPMKIQQFIKDKTLREFYSQA
jgi:glycosyltransferase involved in cell wall biosynthesis